MASTNSMNMDENGVQTYNTTTGNLTGSAMTQYAVVCGDANNKIQNVSGLGTSGQVLTSNGNGALPTWQSISSPDSGTNVNLSDDFIGNDTTSVCPGQLGWNLMSTNAVLPTNATENGHPGICGNIATSANPAGIMLTTTTGPAAVRPFILGGGAMSVTWLIKVATLSTGTNTFTLRCGLGDTLSGADHANGTYFEYTNSLNSGNWVGKTSSASSRSSANSSNAVSTSWVKLRIDVNAAATSVAFFVDGVQIANSPLATNIPTAAVAPFICVTRSAGTIAANSVLIDLFMLTQTLTTPR